MCDDRRAFGKQRSEMRQLAAQVFECCVLNVLSLSNKSML
jgi:hypothetical protein